MTQHGRVRIRDARPDELDEVSKVIVSAYREYAAGMPPEAWQDYVQNIANVRSRLATSELIVAESDGRIVGAVTYYPGGAPAAQEAWPPDWAGIRLLAVLPEARGRGLGRALLEESIRRARVRGASAIGLHTTELMAIPRAMYERMGFVRVPEYDFHPAPEFLVMAYKLNL